MRLITKRLRIIAMTAEELAAFRDTLRRADEGQHVRYAESKLEDGSYLGVSLEAEDRHGQPQPKRAY